MQIQKKHISGLITVAASALAPMATWATGNTPFRASLILSVVAALGSIKNWVDNSLADIEGSGTNSRTA